MFELFTIGGSIGAAATGIVVGFFIANRNSKITLETYQEKADRKAQRAETEGKQIKIDAEEKKEKIKIRIKESEKRSKEQHIRLENLIKSKEEQVKKREDQAKGMEGSVKGIKKEIATIKQKNEEAKESIKLSLSKKTGISRGEAKNRILEQNARDLELMREERLHKFSEHMEENKARIAKDMLVSVIQRYSSPTSVEKKSLSIVVPRDELKGKILGHEAKFLVLLEELTECEIIFNDAPNTIIISCLDLVKKHIARETILKILKEKIVTESTIKQKIEIVKKEMEKHLIKIGKDTIKKLELDKRMKYPDEFCKMMGRLQFRTSYGQNIMKHSFEVGYFTLMLGAEIGVDMETCRIGGFFHDVGKAIDHEVGEPHDVLTKKIMEEYGFTKEEVHAAWTHHDSVPLESPEAMLVKAADAISAGRPGARQETLEKFLEHVRMIEGIATSYEGVKKTYAISAGRELRVIVEPDILEDEHLDNLAGGIAEEIEENKAYPGKIKVNVIRKTTNTEYAKKK